jgi:hypothetical protein
MVTILLGLAAGLIAAGIVAWMAGALYFDVAQGKLIGGPLIVAWLALVGSVWYVSPHPLIAFLAILAAFTLFFRWWRSLKPSHDRNWDPNFARLPRIEIEGEQITVHHVRNTEYRSIDDNDPRFETRRYWLSRLRAIDVLIAYGSSDWISHPIFVFDFGQDGRLCISIEARRRVGQAYRFWGTLYRQYELMYVVSDERDAILRHTKATTGSDLHLYRVFGTQLETRQFFFDYATQINRLVHKPRWYHGVTANCTTGIYTQGHGRWRWDMRMLLNGGLDELLYERGRLDRDIPFRELKRLSRVNEPAHRAPLNGFGDFIRQNLPGYQTEPTATAPAASIVSTELPWNIDDVVQLNPVSSDLDKSIVNGFHAAPPPHRRKSKSDSDATPLTQKQDLSASNR